MYASNCSGRHCPPGRLSTWAKTEQANPVVATTPRAHSGAHCAAWSDSSIAASYIRVAKTEPATAPATWATTYTRFGVPRDQSDNGGRASRSEMDTTGLKLRGKSGPLNQNTAPPGQKTRGRCGVLKQLHSPMSPCVSRWAMLPKRTTARGIRAGRYPKPSASAARAKKHVRSSALGHRTPPNSSRR
jgi:hypothetical protein